MLETTSITFSQPQPHQRARKISMSECCWERNRPERPIPDLEELVALNA